MLSFYFVEHLGNGDGPYKIIPSTSGDMDIMILANVLRIHVDAAFKTGKAFTQIVIESRFHTMPVLGNKCIKATMH